MDSITRTKIDAIWQGMWDNGMADAKTNITQITYLLFIKMLDDAQIKKEAAANVFGAKVKNPTFKEDYYEEANNVTYEDLRWHNFVHFSTEKMYAVVKDYVFKFIRELNAEEDNAASRFMADAKLDIPSGKILEKVIRGLDDDELNLDNKEIMGDVYEYLLAKLSVNGTNGQFRTPRHIIHMMVELMQPKLGEIICDPAMGSAGFLMESAKYIQEHQKNELNTREVLRSCPEDSIERRTYTLRRALWQGKLKRAMREGGHLGGESAIDQRTGKKEYPINVRGKKGEKTNGYL